MGFLQRLFGAPTLAPRLTNDSGHSYMCECQRCIDACVERLNYENYYSKGLVPPTPEEQHRTDMEYHRLAQVIGATSGTHAMPEHKRIMRIMAGEEAEPGKSPA